MLSTKDLFNFFFKLPGDMSHGSPEVCELVWTFVMAEVLGSNTPELWREVQMRVHSWEQGSYFNRLKGGYVSDGSHKDVKELKRRKDCSHVAAPPAAAALLRLLRLLGFSQK